MIWNVWKYFITKKGQLGAKTSKTTGGASTPPSLYLQICRGGGGGGGGGGGVSVARVSSYQHLKCSGNLIITMTSWGEGREGEGVSPTDWTISPCERNSCCLKYLGGRRETLDRGGWEIILVITINNSSPVQNSPCYS